MKVIFITREGYNLAGARVRCYNFSAELAKRGIDTEVLSFADRLGAKDGKKESCMGLREKAGFNWTAFKSLAGDRKAVFYIQRFNYHSFAPYISHLLNKNKMILDLDDWEMRENPRYYFGVYPSSKAHYFTREIAKRSVFCVAASHFLKDFLLRFNKRVYYLPTGVDTELFNPPPKILDKEKMLFSWIGTFNKKEHIENINLALECFCALRNKYARIYFDIAGEGIYENDLVKITARYNDPHIRIKGWIPPDEIPEYLAEIDVGLFPVVGNTNFNNAKSPVKLFEYMAMAKPTVSMDIGEAARIIKDGENGFLVKTRDDFIAKLEELIVNPDLCYRMGRMARIAIEERYSLKILGRRLREMLETING